ncbi:MAG: hypothetical protein MZW92_78610 [Comamonadaceae bacterium]|nr:hypothetical protein [Comamonadaceae bacterium]
MPGNHDRAFAATTDGLVLRRRRRSGCEAMHDDRRRPPLPGRCTATSSTASCSASPLAGVARRPCL